MIINKKIGIIDCGTSNLTSILNALNHLSFHAEIINTSNSVDKFTHLILPGVGAFGQGMKKLSSMNLIPAIKEATANGKYLLGICLGMQLLANSSDEFGYTEGLGLLPGRVTRINSTSNNLRIPHVGWNDVEFILKSPITNNLESGSSFYFVHSYSFVDVSILHTIGKCDYGGNIIAIVQKDNIYGVQFHPEKSQNCGLTILKNFIELC